MELIIFEEETKPKKRIRQIIQTNKDLFFSILQDQMLLNSSVLYNKRFIKDEKKNLSSDFCFQMIKKHLLDIRECAKPSLTVKYIKYAIIETFKHFKKLSSKYTIKYDSLISQFKYNCTIIKYNMELLEQEELKKTLKSNKKNLFANLTNSRLSVLKSPVNQDALLNLYSNNNNNQFSNSNVNRGISNMHLINNKEKKNENNSNNNATEVNFEVALQENNKRKLLKILENQVRKKNKISVYVSDYETLVNRQNEPCEEMKIYDGILLSTKFLKYNPHLLNHERRTLSNVNDLLNLKKDKSIFVPNNDKLIKQKKIIRTRAKKDGIFFEKDNYEMFNNKSSMFSFNSKNKTNNKDIINCNELNDNIKVNVYNSADFNNNGYSDYLVNKENQENLRNSQKMISYNKLENIDLTDVGKTQILKESLHLSNNTLSTFKVFKNTKETIKKEIVENNISKNKSKGYVRNKQEKRFLFRLLTNQNKEIQSYWNNSNNINIKLRSLSRSRGKTKQNTIHDNTRDDKYYYNAELRNDNNKIINKLDSSNYNSFNKNINSVGSLKNNGVKINRNRQNQDFNDCLNLIKNSDSNFNRTNKTCISPSNKQTTTNHKANRNNSSTKVSCINSSFKKSGKSNKKMTIPSLYSNTFTTTLDSKNNLISEASNINNKIEANSKTSRRNKKSNILLELNYKIPRNEYNSAYANFKNEQDNYYYLLSKTDRPLTSRISNQRQYDKYDYKLKLS